MNTNTLHTMAAALAIAGGLVTGVTGSAMMAPSAHAAGPDTVNTSDFPGIDTYPHCALEDCSDVAGIAEDTPGVWVDPDTGNSWLTFSTRSLLIVDDTVHDDC